MIKQFFSSLASKMSCALNSGAQGVLMSKFSSLFLNSANVELTDSGVTVSSVLENFLDLVMRLINNWIYIIAKYILLFIDFCQVIIYKIAGIDNDLEKMVDLPIFKFLLHETVLKVFGAIMILALVILILATIVAIVKSEYEAQVEGKYDPKVMAYKVVGKSAVSLFLMVITPFLVVIAIIFSSVMLSSINNVLNSNQSEQATVGGTLFKTAAYNANKYRLYAADGKRIPVILDFDDPYEDGTYGFYTSEQLYDIYESWNGEEIYEMFASRNYLNFNDALVYKNGKIYNSNAYSDYERFIATAEQYYVMADFIDYAIAHDITYYIKDSNDRQVDWNRSSSGIKITDGVYDPYNKTITITYSDVSNLAPYEDYYTITFDTSTASANSPITDAVSTISLILGLNTIVSGANQTGIKQNSFGPVNQETVSLVGAASSVETMLNSIASTSESSNVKFRILERVEGSLNVVRWQTEKAIYNGQEKTVYTLEKIVRNTKNGRIETKSVVNVAKKDDSLNSKYYVVSETPNQYGYYEYTNVEIDYYNDGDKFLDELTPVYKLVTWPKKLYNDLSIIYSDIDFDNYLSYDNWSDALGDYYKTDNNATSAEVSSFSTTLIHPLGLIMSELFLGTTLEGENGNTSSFSFASSYMEDIINSLTLSVGGQFDYKNMSYQINNFIRMFNAQFASVLESLQKIEGFDVYGKDAYSVQGYVYKAYLASIMLSSEYSDYLNNIAETVLGSQKLMELIGLGAGSPIYDENGNMVYTIKFITDIIGNYQPLYYKDDENFGKAVYTKYGKKHYTLNRVGRMDPTGMYVPKSGVQYKIVERTKTDDNGKIQELWYEYQVYSPTKQKYVPVVEDLIVLKRMYLLSDADYTKAIEAWEQYRQDKALYDSLKAQYDQEVALNGSSSIEVPNVPAVPVWPENPEKFTDYFEPYFDVQSNAAYVYEPVNNDTTLDESAVVGRVAVDFNLIENAAVDSVWEKLNNGSYSTNWLLGEFGDVSDFWGALNEMDNYFIYEVEKSPKTISKYLTYGELPTYYQNFIQNIIETIEKDVEENLFDEPVYLNFLKEYVENGIEMLDVMSAEVISSATADALLKDYDKIVASIKAYDNYLSGPLNPSIRIEYLQKRAQEQTKLNKLKKYYILYGIESFASTQVSSNFTVIVNNHPYNVSQGMVQRELIETVYGNKLLYTSLIGKLPSHTTYAGLGQFDQTAFDQISAYLKYYNQKIRLMASGNRTNAVIFSGQLSDNDLMILSDYYMIKTGNYKSFTNKSLKQLGKDSKDQLLELLKTTALDIDKMLDNYAAGKPINYGIVYNTTIDECYELIKNLTKYAVGNEELYFVEDDYDGLIDDNMQGFSLLRKFLKDFGDLCFNLARSSNLDTIGEFESEDILDYIDDLINILDVKLSELDLGTNFGAITKLNSIQDLATIKGSESPVSADTKFNDLSRVSKEYIYTLYSVYEKKVAEHQAQIETYKNSRDYAARYIAGRYAMQADSFVFTDGLKSYLNYFRYNADIDSETFKDEYVDAEYDGSIESREDRLYYYNLYLESFDDIVLGTKGVYFENLSDLQKKVMRDMAEFYAKAYEEFSAGGSEEYSQNIYNKTLLNAFIFDGITIGSTAEDTVATIAIQKTVSDLFEENLKLLNLHNLLDYVGLDYGINKKLSDYRLDALNALITFKERAGESGASIQARYLTLLYLVCSDYTTNVLGETIISIDAGTKSTILKLAGIDGMPEENIVGLEYEVMFTDSISDERFGSVYVICTYNSETNMYEPFVFASRSDGYGTPSTKYYASETEEVNYFPVIAKGVIGPDGLPTAIRQVNGFIEFYRDNVCIADVGELGLDMYYMSIEDVSINYNPVNIVVNGLSKLFTGKTLAKHIIDSVPVVVSSKNLNFAYGKNTEYVYHLGNGEFTLNYMFYEDTGIKLNCLYEASNFNTIILMFGTLMLAAVLIKAMFGVIRNLYELLILVMICPGVFALYPLKDGPAGNWRKALIDKLLVCFGYIIAVNGYFLILNLLQTLDITLVLSPDSVRELKNTWLFGQFNLETILNTLFTFALFFVAVSLINALPGMFSKMAGGGDVVDRGANTKKLAKINLEEAKYFASGYAIKDFFLSGDDAIKGRPLALLQSDKSLEKSLKAYRKGIDDDIKKQQKANEKQVKALEDKLKNIGKEKLIEDNLAGLEKRLRKSGRYTTAQINSILARERTRMEAMTLADLQKDSIASYEARLNAMGISAAAKARALDAYKKKIEGFEITDEVIKKATKAFKESLDRKVEAERMRREAEFEARVARIRASKSRQADASSTVESEWSTKKKVVYCSHCGQEFKGKLKKGAKCTHCGNPIK